MKSLSELSTSFDSRVPDAWIRPARIAWIALTLVYIGIYLVGIPVRLEELQHTICTEQECLPLILAQGDLPYLERIGISTELYAWYQVGLEVLMGGVIICLAVLIFWRRSNTWIGLLVSLGLIWFGASFLTESNETLARAYPWFSGVDSFLSSLGAILLMLVFFLFPDGRFTPRLMRTIFLLLVLAILVSPLVLIAFSIPIGGFIAVLSRILVGGLLLGAFAQIYRFRRVSGNTQRQQTKWVVFGLFGTASAALIWALVMEIFPAPPGAARVTINIFGMAFLAILIASLPVALAIAILRYRLWDIDVLIRRTLLYSALTGTLALVYFGLVVFLQGIFRSTTGRDNQAILVLTTLAIAALFSPLRQRIQDFIDLRFYRRKYDAERAIEKFSSIARDQVEIDRLSGAMIQVVAENLQPDKIYLWINATDED